MAGIVAYGTYLPRWRLERSRITEALGVPSGRGTRSVASYDEDSTTMGVEAARAALRAAPSGLAPRSLYFATTSPAYLDKANATAIHAALGLDPSVLACDMVGSVRSGVGAIRAALADAPSLLVLADVRTGLPGSADEANGCDGAAAFLTGTEGVVAEALGIASATAEFLDRWRTPGDGFSRVWEERFGESVYVPLGERAVADALKVAGVTPGEVDHLLVCGVHPRAGRALARAVGVRPEAVVDDLGGVIGTTGIAHQGILLADVLDRAEPGQVIVRPILADGVSASVWRVTDEIVRYRAERRRTTVAAQIAAGRTDLAYTTFLTWRGELRREPPRRPDPVVPAAPASFRHEDWKFGFTASRCEACGQRHLPPVRVCATCGEIDRMVPERMADVPGVIATFTVDRLTYSMSPPVVAAVIDFEGGGRFRCELTDVDPDAVGIGDRVEMTFRRISTSATGIHNYFWKARPAPQEA
jgi:3-hydroxy-3-methylglutaryl CoA synthase/uncharacterized OB-fold protein